MKGGLASMDWDDAEEIAFELHDKYPDTDPLSLRFTDLHRMILELDGFEGAPAESAEGKLEAVVMAWLEEKKLGE